MKLKNKILLITGGTGSLGSILVERLLKEDIKEVRVYSRDEFKQAEMARHLNDKRITYWLGDVRNLERLVEACDSVDIIIHIAAMKRMDQSSHNTFEVADINIQGTKNVMIAGKNCKKIIFVSTDKAYHAENVYGASKFIAERIVLADKKKGIVWRFGNFIGSRGSVWEIFKEQKEKRIPLTITNLNASRFVIDMKKVCDYILSNVKPGLYYPKKLKIMTVGEIADEIAHGFRWEIVGLREGEKMHEAFNENYSSDKCL